MLRIGRALSRRRALPKLPERHPSVCLNNDGTVIGMYHPSEEFEVKFEDTMPLPVTDQTETTNEGRLKLELLRRGDGLDSSTPLGPNQASFGPQTVDDMWKWFDRDHYIAASHLSDIFKMSNDHFVQNMSNKQYYRQSENGRQWVPRRHALDNNESLVPEEPPKFK